MVGFMPGFRQLARPAIRRFVERNPGVEVDVRHLQPAERLSNPRAGAVDVEILLPPPVDAPDLVVATVDS